MFEDKKDLPYNDIPEPMGQEVNGVDGKEDSAPSSFIPPMPGGVAPEDAGDFAESFSVEEEVFKEIEEGRYPGRLISVEAAKSKAGNKMYVWTYAITKGEFQGTELINRTALTPNAMWKLKETLVALDVKPVNGVYNFTPGNVLNKDVVLDVELQEYEGKTSPSINQVLHKSVGHDVR